MTAVNLFGGIPVANRCKQDIIPTPIAPLYNQDWEFADSNGLMRDVFLNNVK